MLQYLFSFIEHHASFLHWDFRIRVWMDAVSFAISEGPSMVPNLPRLARQMPDHLSKNMFSEKTIPPGLYGAGERRVWDAGYLSTEKDILIAVKEGYIKFFLKGTVLWGNFELKIGSDRDRDWELIKLEDEWAKPNFVLKQKLESNTALVIEQSLVKRSSTKRKPVLVQPTLF